MSLYLRLRNAGRALLGRDPLVPGNPWLHPLHPGTPWYYVNDRSVSAEEAQARWQARRDLYYLHLPEDGRFSIDLPLGRASYKDEDPDAPYDQERDPDGAERPQAPRNRLRSLRPDPEPLGPLSRAQRTPGDPTDPDAWDHRLR